MVSRPRSVRFKSLGGREILIIIVRCELLVVNMSS